MAQDFWIVLHRWHRHLRGIQAKCVQKQVDVSDPLGRLFRRHTRRLCRNHILQYLLSISTQPVRTQEKTLGNCHTRWL
jgi:hypothetical protein